MIFESFKNMSTPTLLPKQGVVLFPPLYFSNGAAYRDLNRQPPIISLTL